MSEFEFGPVELHLVSWSGDRPDAGALGALVDLVDDGVLRLLDLVIIAKSAEGDLSVLEIEHIAAEYEIDLVELPASGIVGDDDIESISSLIPAGTSAALVAYELVYARELTRRLHEAGAVVLQSERIPATVVNEVLGLAE